MYHRGQHCPLTSWKSPAQEVSKVCGGQAPPIAMPARRLPDQIGLEPQWLRKCALEIVVSLRKGSPPSRSETALPAIRRPKDICKIRPKGLSARCLVQAEYGLGSSQHALAPMGLFPLSATVPSARWVGSAQTWISDPWIWRAGAKSMDRGRCPPQNAASAASFGGGNPRFPMETGPVANPRPLDPCLRSPDSCWAR